MRTIFVQPTAAAAVSIGLLVLVMGFYQGKSPFQVKKNYFFLERGLGDPSFDGEGTLPHPNPPPRQALGIRPFVSPEFQAD